MYILPLCDSCHTIPSRLTQVPGSQGPRHSGSVTTPTLQVSTDTSHVGDEDGRHGIVTSGVAVACGRAGDVTVDATGPGSGPIAEVIIGDTEDDDEV